MAGTCLHLATALMFAFAVLDFPIFLGLAPVLKISPSPLGISSRTQSMGKIPRALSIWPIAHSPAYWAGKLTEMIFVAGGKCKRGRVSGEVSFDDIGDDDVDCCRW